MVDDVTKRRIRSKKNTDLKHFIQREVMAGSRNYGTHCNTRIPLDEEAQIQMAMRESLREPAEITSWQVRVEIKTSYIHVPLLCIVNLLTLLNLFFF
jgi:hypothetical protein